MDGHTGCDDSGDAVCGLCGLRQTESSIFELHRPIWTTPGAEPLRCRTPKDPFLVSVRACVRVSDAIVSQISDFPPSFLAVCGPPHIMFTSWAFLSAFLSLFESCWYHYPSLPSSCSLSSSTTMYRKYMQSKKWGRAHESDRRRNGKRRMKPHPLRFFLLLVCCYAIQISWLK